MRKIADNREGIYLLLSKGHILSGCDVQKLRDSSTIGEWSPGITYSNNRKSIFIRGFDTNPMLKCRKAIDGVA